MLGSALLCLAFATSGAIAYAPVGGNTAACSEPAHVKAQRLEEVCPSSAGSGARCQSLVLRDVCLVQETFVLFDADAADAHPDGAGASPFAEFDVTTVPFWFRHASPERMDRLVHDSPHPHEHPSSVLGHQINFPSISSRFASSREIDAAPVFQSCSVPVVVYTPWVMNYAEAFIRAPTLLHALGDAWNGTQVAYATPLKLPIDDFMAFITSPFSIHPAVSFAELSALRRDGNLTNHEACYDTVVLLKITNGAFPELPDTANAIVQHHQPLPRAPWHSDGPSVTRVVFEQRPNKAMRQFLGLDEVLAACASDGTLECRAHEFGVSYVDDMALMQGADVLVAYHGAGETNSLYMPRHSAILEIRAREFGTKHGWWSAFWWPSISLQTQHSMFFWGLNVEDPSLNTNSPMEAEGLEHDPGFNARDRFVTLRWEFLKLMLDKVIAHKRDAASYRALFNEKGVGVVWTWDGRSLVQEPPIFCDGSCASPTNMCKPC
jgi:hypothetical protein